MFQQVPEQPGLCTERNSGPYRLFFARIKWSLNALLLSPNFIDYSPFSKHITSRELYSFLWATVTNCHQFGGFKQHTHVFSYVSVSQKSKISFPGMKPWFWLGHPHCGALGENPFAYFFWYLKLHSLRSLAHGPCLHFQSQLQSISCFIGYMASVYKDREEKTFFLEGPEREIVLKAAALGNLCTVKNDP